MTTCHSPLSRNFQIGVRLAQGQPLVEVMKNLVGTAEGVASTEALVSLVSDASEMLPIAVTISVLLKSSLLGETPPMPLELIQSLMTRRPRVEC